jgi:hypothetical protein
MLDEAKKREKIANAVLGLTFAASAAQSPKDFVKTGHVESPGTALMQMWAKKRGEAERNLDSGRVSHPARNRKKKTFKEFVEETYISEAQRHFSSRAELEKHHGGIPSGYYPNNAGSTESPKWRLKPKSGGVGERIRRKERIGNLSSAEERESTKSKIKKIKAKGNEAHHITPLHYSAKLKASMSPSEWEARVKRDAKQGVYHGHHPKNIMGAKKSTDPADKPGIYHRKGGAHEIEHKTKDIVSGSIPHKELLAAAARRAKKKSK